MSILWALATFNRVHSTLIYYALPRMFDPNDAASSVCDIDFFRSSISMKKIRIFSARKSISINLQFHQQAKQRINFSLQK